MLFMAGHERHGGGQVALRQGDARITSRRERRGDAWHDLEGHAGRNQRRAFLSGMGKDQRIATLEAHDGLACAGRADHPRVDLVLRHDAAVAVASQALERCAAPCALERSGIHQIVVEHKIGAHRHSAPRSVSRPGSPGPAPTK